MRTGSRVIHFVNVLFITCGMMIFSQVAGAAIYKWTDENGKVHYGSERPASQTSERMEIKIREPVITEKKEEGEAAAVPGDESKAAPEPETPVMSRKEKQRICSEARQEISRLGSKARFRVMGSDGEMRYLNDSEVAKRVRDARKDMDQYCN